MMMSESAVSLSPVRRIAILITVVMSATLYSTTILIVSTILPQMQGTLSATADEISWVMTFNILATAVITPMTGWLVARVGTRGVMVWSVTGFTVATYFCGSATTLETLIIWRVLQGGFGAAVTPLSQSIILETFPKRQHGLVVGLYGMGVVFGAFIGPTLGGIMAELYSWRWAFYLIVPVGAASAIGLWLALPRGAATKDVRLDWTGFLSLSVALAAAQLVLSRGQRLDWFDSPEIVLETFIGVLSFYVFLAHSLTAERPFLNLKFLLNRNYALGLVLVTIYGMLNFTPMVLLPPLLRQHAGFPDATIGFIIGCRGIGALFGFFAAMFFGQRYPRKSMAVGFALQMASGLWLMTIDLNVGVTALAVNSLVQGLAVGAVWVPLTVVTFSTLEPRDLPETSAVYHLLRNMGSSLFISLCVTEIVRTTGMSYGQMSEFISPFNEVLTMPWVTGGWSFDTVPGLLRVSKELTRQSAMIGYLNAFGMYTAVSAAAIPLTMLMVRQRSDKALKGSDTDQREADARSGSPAVNTSQ